MRAFRPDPIPPDRLQDLVELANWAPSAGNLQSRDFVVVRDPATRRALAEAADQAFVAEAPAILVVCANLRRVQKYGQRGRDLYALQDAAAAVQNFMLAAHAADLATVWVGAFDEAAVRRVLNLPVHARPVILAPVGLPSEAPPPPERLPLGEILHWDRW